MVIKILVATHKDVVLPSGGIYSPVLVGSSLHSEILNKFQPDNEEKTFLILILVLMSLQRFIGHGRMILLKSSD